MFLKLIPILFFLGSFFLPAEVKIESLGDLKKLQSRVVEVVRKNTAVTVSLISSEVGASGSGVIVSPDGLILTAAHVIEGSEFMTVVFPDGSQEKARVLGANFSRDAAIAKLLGEGPWPFAEMGDSRSLEVGDFVVAMGHPKGYDPTRRPPVRFGRVMTKRRFDFITSDCTLIGGDSGGPLFNLEGKVVAIHSNISSDRQVNNHTGLSGFQRSWDLMLAGKFWGSLLGLKSDPDRPVLGLHFRKADVGLVVDGVPEGGPASKAGFLPGDVVVSIADQKVRQLDDLSEAFADLITGMEVKVILLRGGNEMTKVVRLAPLKEIYQSRRR